MHIQMNFKLTKALIFAAMTIEEEKFLTYWTVARKNYFKSPMAYLKGFSGGIVLGVFIVLLIASGWYQRANMVANAQANPFVLLMVIIAVSVGMGFIYRRFKWEMNEQKYAELMHKKNSSSLHSSSEHSSFNQQQILPQITKNHDQN